ncbi:MAG TPA: protein-disulfide reductase DsbD domain-containing protein, partial [Thermoanaerobaculia bacterium]|nr:protein-disulfide reductase DsbD domain-containing protein [Thermoanaerobaculia bacterium]
AAGRAAERAAAALAEAVGRRPAAFPYLLRGLDQLRHGEAGPIEHSAGAALRAELSLAPRSVAAPAEPGRFAVNVELLLDEGWHANAHRPLAEDLEPTVLRLGAEAAGWRLDSVGYPPGERVELGFREGEMAVYSGAVTLTAELERLAQLEQGAGEPAFVVPVELDVQVCNDRLCLQPETLRLEATPASWLRPPSAPVDRGRVRGRR